jgi:hydrogenase maturation protein HypF
MRIQSRRLELRVTGIVQGVGFRPFVYREAVSRHLVGWVRNGSDAVRIEVEGPAEDVDAFVETVRQRPPEGAVIEAVDVRELPRGSDDSFRIHESTSEAQISPSVPPDLATCAECFAEVADPSSRRHRYPFTNCTQCGPRFTIVRDLPYDRSRTSMSAFPMCEECRREYEDPADRRFHAQPIACPRCGPVLRLLTPAGSELARADDALREAVAAVLAGRILALQGLGGFQLVADATNGDAVDCLRRRKHRPDKPFALLMADVESVRDTCVVSPTEEAVLRSPVAPIVLLERRSGTAPAQPPPLAPEIAPGNPRLGVMLPYTPLHRLLVLDAGRPLVCTSGNLADEPLSTDPDEALVRLGGIADLFLVHDRPIVRPVDDSVAVVEGETARVLRRARGHAPVPLLVAEDSAPILAVGGHLKSTVSLRLGRRIVTSQHLGDLSSAEGVAHLERAVEDLLRFYRVRPAAVVRDLHPDYASTRLAERLGAEWSIPVHGVQHHHAHVESCRAEHDFAGEVLGLAWDGSGYGSDGTVWGGEALLSSPGRFRRVAHLRPFPLPGGERAILEPRRAALGMLYAAFGPAAAERLASLFAPAELATLGVMLERSINGPPATSVGRLFDAVAALAGLCARASFEGQAAMALQAAVERAGTARSLARAGAYPLPLENGTPAVADWEPLLHAVLEDRVRGVPPDLIGARLHNGLAEHAVEVAGRAGRERVVLTGGCFQNTVLTARVRERLEHDGFRVFTHRRVPPNDGGISVGQAMIGAALEREGA